MLLTKKITMGGREFELGPLNLRGVVQFTDKFSLIGQRTPEAIDLLVDVIHFSLELDYPDVERRFVDRHLSLENQLEIVTAFAEVNGLIKKPAPEAAATPKKKQTGKK